MRALWVVLAFVLSTLHAPLYAQRGGFGKGERAPAAAPEEAAVEQGLVRPSGLQPRYPAEARCPEIASPYGSRTRYDGSPRPTWAFGGFHGGIDISLPDGTPLLALAAGRVAAKGQGGMMEGFFLWLRHAPEDTGLPYWVYSKYQHLEALPELELGASVKAGQPIARSGSTGTVGRHYGAGGYPHLHLTTRRSSRGDEAIGAPEAARSMPLFDPLAIYHEAADAPASPEVAIPYASGGGKVFPPGARVVWPVACPPR